MSRLLVFAHGLPTKRVSQSVRTSSTIGVLVLICLAPARAVAQDHSHDGLTSNRGRNANALVQAVREATERFKDVAAAENEEYHLLFGCVSGPDYGAMGLHYVNLGAVFDGGELDPAHPEIVLYEALPDGRVRITGADFLVIAKDWDDIGLPDFYTLHVWAWKESPTGTFANWHSNVSCDGFQGQ